MRFGVRSAWRFIVGPLSPLEFGASHVPPGISAVTIPVFPSPRRYRGDVGATWRNRDDIGSSERREG